MAVRNLTENEMVSLRRFKAVLEKPEDRAIVTKVIKCVGISAKDFCLLLWSRTMRFKKKRMSPQDFLMLKLISETSLDETNETCVEINYQNTAVWFRHWNKEIENGYFTEEQNKTLRKILLETITEEDSRSRNKKQYSAQVARLLVRISNLEVQVKNLKNQLKEFKKPYSKKVRQKAT